MLYRSHLITAASGKLNGTIFAHNAGGPYARAFTVPTDPATARQINCREAMAACYAWWRDNLTDADRTAWQSYADSITRPNRIGDRRSLAGFDEFCKQAFLKFQINEQLGAAHDPGTTPPIYGVPFLTPPSATLADAGATLRVAWSSNEVWEGDQDNFIAVYASTARRGTINFFKGPYQLIGEIPGDVDDPPVSPIDFALLDVPEVGERIFYRLRFAGNDRPLSMPWPGMLQRT